MRLFGLIGYPLTHSFSKKYFEEKFRKEGLGDCHYELFSISEINELKRILETYPNLEGLNVTIPYKKQVLGQLYSSENIPSGLNACNCIKIKEGKLIGYNTDVSGFEKSIKPLLKPHHRHALILGNGGATAAVVFVLRKLGIAFDIASRKLHVGSTLIYNDLDEKIIHQNTVIINTTPLGMYPDQEECPDLPYHFITKNHLLVDLIYNPAKTIFLQKGEEHGAVIKNGEEMLVIQAEESWRIWNESGSLAVRFPIVR